MNLVFRRTMMQRYRAISHFIDPLIEHGHKLTVEVATKNFRLDKLRQRPQDAFNGSKKSLKYIMDCLGIPCKHFDKVNFIEGDGVAKGLSLTVDQKPYKKGKVAWCGLPYTHFYCYPNGNKTLVGNPMSQLMREAISSETVEPGTIMTIHPGGGRGYVSPSRKNIPDQDVINNNKKMFDEFLSLLPPNIKKVTIKTHPVPYKLCDKSSLDSYLIPYLSNRYTDKEIVTSDTNLVKLCATNEFVTTFGGTTFLWLVGSKIKWLKVMGFPIYISDREKNKPWMEPWEKWNQNIDKEQLNAALTDYESQVNEKNKDISIQIEEYENIHNMDCTARVVELINQMGK